MKTFNTFRLANASGVMGKLKIKVELLSGPVLSDIEQGCVLPTAPQLTVCPSGATYCNPDTPWQNAPEYVYNAETRVGTWSGDSNCAWDAATYTTPAENQAWKAMSIVNGGSGTTFSFPKTAMSGWLCESVYQGNLCSQHPGLTYCMNNSSSEGQLFYTAVANAGPPVQPFKVYPVTTCDDAEGVSGPDAQVPGINNENGLTAISNDMMLSPTNTNGCKKIGSR
jgi:hypothetical protein